MIYKTKHYQLTLASHELNNEQLRHAAAGAAAALCLRLHTNHIPFLTVNEYDELDGYNCTLTVNVDSIVP